jgi:alkanesulfonate monooxygenase SsuD/methylene tetrahydromethanopterin reductase-like flavin-dependent oxidoreductase (luciferase family)
MSTRFGLLVPHFGLSADPDLLVQGARLAEGYDFDSLWVRDHLIFQPHGMEGTGDLFVEPFVTLAYLAGSTERIGLGTATLIPTRHPIQMAQSVASLSWLTTRTVDLGFGAGNFQHEFEAIGLGNVDRPKLAAEQLDIANRLWGGEEVSHHSATYDFDGVRLTPAPREPVRVWWGGVAPASTRLAVEHCDGWLASRLDLGTYDVRVRSIREQCERLGRPPISLGNIPITSLGETRAEALACVNLAGLLEYANGQRFVVKPRSGRFETAEDLAGGLMAGTPDDVVRDLDRLVSTGCDLVVFDLRFRFADWLDQIRILGEHVLPTLRRQIETRATGRPT